MGGKPYPITHSGANLREAPTVVEVQRAAARDQSNQPPGSIAMTAHPESVLFSRCWLLSGIQGLCHKLFMKFSAKPWIAIG